MNYDVSDPPYAFVRCVVHNIFPIATGMRRACPAVVPTDRRESSLFSCFPETSELGLILQAWGRKEVCSNSDEEVSA